MSSTLLKFVKGCGKQGFGAAINAIGYMFVSLPLAYVLGIHPYKKGFIVF